MSIELESHLSDFSNHSNDNRIMIVNWCLCFVIEKKKKEMLGNRKPHAKLSGSIFQSIWF